jgi:hypothetical protein
VSHSCQRVLRINCWTEIPSRGIVSACSSHTDAARSFMVYEAKLMTVLQYSARSVSFVIFSMAKTGVLSGNLSLVPIGGERVKIDNIPHHPRITYT